jgi:tryptophanyl-tRNA synthetase
MPKPRVFSGIQPTGDLHLGNYFGAIKNWVEMQEKYECIFCIVDLHAITVPRESETLRQDIRKTAALLLSCGINPEKSVLFVQSQLSSHAELAWILNCQTPIGWLSRMTQYKEKKAGKQAENVSTGLFDYPVLMAADILLYNTDLVPVGEDQKQHVELCVHIAERFNSKFGETFKIPKAMMPKIGARIMSLKDPTKKMSKSDANPDACLYLTDTPDEIDRKVASATTDSLKDICFDKARPGIYNLLTLYELAAGISGSEVEERFRDKGYAVFKQELAQVIIKMLAPMQKRFRELMANPHELEAILSQNAEKIRPLAQTMIRKVKEKVGLW